eukprot:8054793-Karenia_brevis.AAC.1
MLGPSWDMLRSSWVIKTGARATFDRDQMLAPWGEVEPCWVYVKHVGTCLGQVGICMGAS